MESQQVSKCLIAFATGWGSQLGGINVFNFQFLEQLAFACKGRVSVVCVVPTLPFEQEPARDVKLVRLPYPPVGGKLDATHAQAAIDTLRSKGISLDPDGLVWLGHDRITGEIALQAKALVGGRTALIHHMSYGHYEGYAESSASASVKSAAQREMFNQADVRMAVGPLLRDALEDMVPDARITMLVPGQDEIRFYKAPNRFTAFMSGRFSADTARIKQGHLGVAAFAEAQRRASTEAGLPDPLKNQPKMILRGVDMEPEGPASAVPNVEYWRRFAADRADRVVDVEASPYSTKRSALLEQLARASVVLMPSWHEGFGLAGWEAVAAGVPLILSQKSGLYQWLNEESAGSWLGWVYPVDIQGSVDEPFFHANDLKRVSDHLIEIAKEPGVAREKAVRLRERTSDFTWKRCVDVALEGLGWSDLESSVPEPLPPLVDLRTATVPALTPPITSPLELPKATWQPGLGLADSQLLRAEEAAVAFDPAREPEISQLLDWATGSDYTQALRLITASGGTGKTRLALELCTRLGEQGWHCGFVRSEIGATKAAGAWAELSQRNEPLLVVFDYAETRQEAVLSFVRAMLQSGTAKGTPPLRILLLARGGGEWWDRLSSRDPVAEPFLSGYATSGPVTLLPLHNRLEDREEAFQAAMRAYAQRMGVEEVPELDVDLTGEHFGRPLYVQMAALLALYGERPASAEGLTRALLHHERRYWAHLLRNQAPSAPAGLDDRDAAELMTLATLAGGFPRPADAGRLWKQWDGSSGQDLLAAQQRAVFEQLAPLYPGHQGLQPLRPDLLGEGLVAHALLQPSGDRLLDALLSSSNSNSQRRSALTVVARLSKHRPDIEGTVVQSLSRHFVACAADLVKVATQSDSHLPDWAEQAFTQLPPSLRAQAAGVLSPLMGHESVQLAQLACAVSHAEVEKNRGKVDKKPRDVDLRADYARSLRNHAVALARAGQSGLIPGRQSMELYNALVAKNPSRFVPEWAASLGNYANRLANDGQDAEALIYEQKALEAWERLAAKNAHGFEPDLARSLGNYAIRLTDNGHDVAALTYEEKALRIRERLAAKNPDRFEPDLATSLGNYAISLASNGQDAEALIYGEKALEILERLGTKNADRFEPDLARTLSNYAARLADNGNDAEALAYEKKALEIRERLAAKNPDRFEPALGTSLGNYASSLAENGLYSDALTQARRALQIMERLKANQPLRFAEDYYNELIRVQWAAWLSHELPHIELSEEPLPDPAWCRPHRLPVLRIYRASVQGCRAKTQEERASAFREVLNLGSDLEFAQFRDVELYWLCAAAWCATYAATKPGGGDWEQRLRQTWTAFLRRRGGRIPHWMEEVARRLAFEWPVT